MEEEATVGGKNNLRKSSFLFIKNYLSIILGRYKEQKYIPQVAMPDTLILAVDNKTPARTDYKGLVLVQKLDRISTQGGFQVGFHFGLQKPKKKQCNDKWHMSK